MSTSTKTILVVEDEAGVRTMVSMALEGEGHTVLLARDGAEALDIAAEHASIDLVISDVIMPGLSGPQLVERLRIIHPSIQVLFMSGYSGDHLTEHGLPSGAELVAKPCSIRELLERVRRLLEVRDPQ